MTERANGPPGAFIIIGSESKLGFVSTHNEVDTLKFERFENGEFTLIWAKKVPFVWGAKVKINQLDNGVYSVTYDGIEYTEES